MKITIVTKDKKLIKELSALIVKYSKKCSSVVKEPK